MGANLFLLEDLDEGGVKALVEEGKDWLGQWFKEVMEWKSNYMDPE